MMVSWTALRKLCWSVSIAVAFNPSTVASEVPRKPYLSSETAKLMVDACLDYAKRNNFEIAVAVVDDGGHLLTFHRTANLRYNVVRLTTMKAVSAYEAARPTSALQAQFKGGDLTLLPLGQYPLGGGLPIIMDGHVVGGIGTGAAGREREEQCSQAAIDAVGAKSSMTTSVSATQRSSEQTR